MNTSSRTLLSTFAFAASLLAGGSAWANPDARFQEAVASYRSARYAEAFGRLYALAIRGDADAARIVLFMHGFGPTLYGSHWDLNPEEIQDFRDISTAQSHRRQPAFEPAWQPRLVKANRQRK